MRRMCGLSSQIRNRSLLKSMRYMVGPDAAKQYTGVNHIAVLVKERLRGRRSTALNRIIFQRGRPGLEPGPIRRGSSVWAMSQIPLATTGACVYGSRLKAGTTSGSELLAQDAFLEAVAGIEQHPHRDGLVGQHL